MGCVAEADGTCQNPHSPLLLEQRIRLYSLALLHLTEVV